MSDGDWIDIRYELTTGQQREMFRTLRKPGEDRVDLAEYNRARLLAYIVRWSLVDARGAVAPVSDGALDFLDTDTFRELVQAIDAHDEAITEEKKRRTNATDFAATLQSVG